MQTMTHWIVNLFFVFKASNFDDFVIEYPFETDIYLYLF